MNEKCPKMEFFSGPCFPVFSLNTGKYGPEKAPYLDTFHAVESMKNIATVNQFKNKLRNRTHSIITFAFMETVVYQNAY